MKRWLVGAVAVFSGVATAELPPQVEAYRGGSASSKVAGRPDGPLPYTVEKALPGFPIERLIGFRFEPGTDQIVYIDQVAGAKNTRLRRYDFEENKAITILEPDEFIYSIEFHPKFEETGYIFLGTNGPAGAERVDRRALIVRYTVSRDEEATIDPASAFEILSWPSKGHNGTAIAFDPDGLMYFTSGDGTSDSDTDLTGQRLDLYLAKVMRVDIDHPDPGKPYSIPPDNPFLNTPGAKPETFAYGFRNPWRASWDPILNRLWVGQNGQDRLEQVYLVEPGANYGWSVYEGSRIFYEGRERGPTPISPPTFEHGHAVSRSLTGGSVYTGSKLPDLTGAYVYGDYATGKIWAGRHDGKQVTWHEEIADTQLGLTEFLTSPDGQLLIANYQADDSGGFYELVPNRPSPSDGKFPMKLSETGLFESVAEHKPAPGVMPYSVNLPQWSDGAYQERYLALPAEDPHIAFSAKRWKLPENAVALQSLKLGDRWIETRLMVQQQAEWVGYTYAWNEAQTDAELVGAEGMEKEINGLKWKFESRSSCMICHSRSGNYLLGLQTEQLNRDHDYGGGFVANQLDVMNELGFFQPKGKPADAPSLMRKPAETFGRFPDPFDATVAIEERARAYLDATCSHCHVESGGGNAMIDLRQAAKDDKMMIFNEPPNHGDQGLGPDARLVVPGDAAKSIMFHRVAQSGPGQMPPMAQTTPDPRAVTLLLEWIATPRPVPEPPPAPKPKP